ncbi:LacI family DNA-binding transcriptional regulator [Nakamurella deserti]|uniref:LacI family DNA-binding transcriptional regulator n=1 Tax=Nakamurella deserti TaxID=2164074 RepID=UPI000DBE8445|nr:LacI family DNA-binding transcriptional regulator [Nakamurella deserti]
MVGEPSRPPTIRDVAAAAGVSKSLVSLVLQNSDKVGPAKRAAVERAIAELGYRPNATARHLSQRRTSTVGVLLNDLRNPWYVDCLEGLAATLGERGYRMYLGDSRLDSRTDDLLTQGFLDFPVDGLVLVGTMPLTARLQEATRLVPTVVAASRDVDLPGVDVIAGDDSAGATLAVDHLVALGHRRIAHIAGNAGRFAELRRDSYVAAMARHGLDPRIETSDATEEGGYRAAVRLLSPSGDRPTAVFAVNDVACIGAISAADELGLDLPRDLSVVGFDNTHLAQLRHLWLTSVDIAGHALGRRAGEALLRRIDRPDTPATAALMPATLHVRGSSVRPG